MTRRKINFDAVITYTAYPFGAPGKSPLAIEGDTPVCCTAHAGIAAMNTAAAIAELTKQTKARAVVAEVINVALTLRRPNDDAALLAERDAA